MSLQKYRIHKEGYGFFAFFATGAFFLYQIHIILGLVATWGAGWCLYFFRLPTRSVPKKPGSIVSPADGHVVSVQKVVPPLNLNLGLDPYVRISIFLTIFDVHANYIPISGRVRSLVYQKGHFFHAGKDKASEQNERNSLVIDVFPNCSVGVVQIAGLVARRIRCDVCPGQTVKTGQYYGLIRFGSRVEVYLPVTTEIKVKAGDKVQASHTVLGQLDQ